MSVRSEYRKRYARGDVIIKEGDKGTDLFVLEKGQLDVFIKGRKVGVIDAVVSQEFFGEVAALLGEKRTATVVAATDCLILRIPKIEIEAVLQRAPSLSAKLARSLCRKLTQSARANAVFEQNESLVVKSGSTDVSLRNYMKGLYFLIDLCAEDTSGKTAARLKDYFLKTNPWGIAEGDHSMIVDG